MFKTLLAVGGLFALGIIKIPAQTPAVPPSLAPVLPDGRELASTMIEVGGRPVRAWQSSRQMPALRFKLRPSPAKDRYVQVTYLDRGYDRLAVTYKNRAGVFVRPEKVLGTVLLDTAQPKVAYAMCSDPADAPEIEVKLANGAASPFTVFSAAAQSEPFPDAHLQYILDEAWKRPYDGPSIPGVENGTLKNRVMVGYQGWFRTPNDPYGDGWRHWGNIDRGEFSVDMWPDNSQYPASCLDKAAAVITRSGQATYLFSSAWPEVVRQHFAWMRQHGIDGAFVQRFVPAGDKEPDWVLGNVRAAANQEGRLWAVEYDVSGCPDERLLDQIKKDWAWLVDEFGIRQDKSYAREGDKPVVFVWGMPFDDRHISLETANAVVNFLKHDPKYGGACVIGGIPAWWTTLGDGWRDHVAKYDAALVWQSTRFDEDRAALEKIGVTYYPMVRPGFSWANLKHLPTDSVDAFDPRRGGDFYEDQLAKALAAKADRFFVGMFDEYDEGTAIMPMSDDPPPTNQRPGTNAFFSADRHFGESPVVRLLPQIDLALDGLPPDKRLPTENFSVRFRGQILPLASGAYAFEVRGPAGDIATLRIGDREIRLDDLSVEKPPLLTAALTARQPVPFMLECRHADGSGRLQLLWSRDGAPLEIVPSTAYLDAWGRFLTNEGKPADWWLSLTERWAEKLRQPPNN